ncbi:MAG: hypothetical protein IJT49_04305 [Clostridia bacterium]|nr:hypothetical protein [Clostridia bacterium]
MKKITAIILACLTLIFTVTAGAAKVSKGDVNRDGTVDNKDVVVLFRHVSGVIYDVFDPEAANMNDDNAVNNKDVTLLFRYISSPHEPTDKPVVIGMSYVDGRYLVYGSAEPFSVIRSVDAYGGEAENVCNNKYFYVEVSASEGDKLSFYATAPGKLESQKTSVTVTASAYSSNIFVGKNSRIFYLPTRSFLEGCEADTNSLAAIKSYISGKTIKEIQKVTGKKTKLIYAIIPDPATAYYDEQNFEIEEPVNSAMRSFVKEIDGCHEDVYALDLFSVMREHKDERIYFSTDTHYTELGAYYVYMDLMKRVSKDHPDTVVKTLENEDYNVEYIDVPGGDMCGMAGISMNEVVPFFVANFTDTGSYYISKRNDGIKSAGFGPTGWQRDSELSNSANPTAYFIGDSYGCYILPFIGANFSKVWTNEKVLWNYPLDKSILEENKPDYVIFLVCQRNVGTDFLNNLIATFSMSVNEF